MIIEEEKVEIVEDATKKKGKKISNNTSKKIKGPKSSLENVAKIVENPQKVKSKKNTSKANVSKQNNTKKDNSNVLNELNEENKVNTKPETKQISTEAVNTDKTTKDINISDNNSKTIKSSKKEETVNKENLNSDKNSNLNNYSQVKSKHSFKRVISIIAIFLCVLIILVLVLFGAFAIYNHSNNTKVSNNIFINGIEISGLTLDESKSKINDYYSDKLSTDITLVYNDYKHYIKTSEINLNYDLNSAVEYAYEYGKTGNILNDNYNIFNAILNGLNVTPTYTLDENSLRNILTTISPELPDSIIESGYYIEDNNLIITKGKEGIVINVDSTLSNIKNGLTDLSYLTNGVQIEATKQSPKQIDINAIYNEVHKDPVDAYYTTNPYAVFPSKDGVDFSVSIEEANNKLQTSDSECKIPLKTLHPKVTTNMIGQEAFPELLAEFSTRYSSNADRTTNLRLAANKINGTVLMPGEIFSYNGVVGERTIAAGYKSAAIYQNGEVVDGIGGGICQISSTLYNAALFANLEMVELYNHQFVPSYLPAGRDATVVYGVKDFKFKNSRQHAIKITCSVSGGIAKFQIWGIKEQTEYDVDVYANVSRTSSYIKATTYRTLKLNGETIKTEKIANSTYKIH